MVKAFLVAVAAGCCGSLAAQTPALGAPAETCVKELTTPVRHVCGVIFTRQGQVQVGEQQVRSAILTLMLDGTLVEREETHDKASFDFTKSLTDGSYDLIVEAANHTASRFRIIVHKPIQKCNKGVLLLTMPLRAECGDIEYMPNRSR